MPKLAAMSQIGTFCVLVYIIMANTKYGFQIDDAIINQTLHRLINQIWKLIPMKENEENWQGQLDKVIVEVSGLHVVLSSNDKFLLLLANLEGLKVVDISFVEYRSKVFESISLLRELRYGTKESNETI